jgi:phosphonate transport system substrate-binding protein
MVAVASVISPKGNIASYSDLVAYLGRKMGRRAEMVQRSTYAETNDLLRQGRVDIALVCSGAYVEGHNRFGMELLAAPQVDGQVIYYSFVIVPIESGAQSFSGLKGGTFAFTDPLSNSGYYSPLELIRRLGETPESFFRRTIFTYSHDNSIKAVSQGLVDGAAVDSLVYKYFISREPSLGNRLRIIERSVPYGMPPIVASPIIETPVKTQLKEIFLNMHNDPEGRRIIADLAVDRFVTIDDAAYESVRNTMASQ